MKMKRVSFILFCLLAPVIVVYYLFLKIKDLRNNANCCKNDSDCCKEEKMVEAPRLDKILKYLQTNKSATVPQLLTLFPNVTDRTLRRDLNKMEKQRLVVRSGSTKSVFYTLK
jgi:predicted HTH transcriptional regulator